MAADLPRVKTPLELLREEHVALRSAARLVVDAQAQVSHRRPASPRVDWKKARAEAIRRLGILLDGGEL